jgi:acetoin utilization protein AcuB
MLVQAWMNTDVVTVREDAPMTKGAITLKENNIRTLPVVDKKGKLVGIVTDRDLRDAAPSKATSLNMYELNYLISKIKMKDIMSKNLVVVHPEETVEFAAILMLENKISALPVVNKTNTLIGIITQTDIFRVLVHITGVYTGGVQFAFSLEDRPGSIKEVADTIRAHGGRVVSILSTREGAEEGRHNVYVRIRPLPKEELRALSAVLEKEFMVLYSARDIFEEIKKRRTIRRT